jgi:hypothetical protein
MTMMRRKQPLSVCIPVFATLLWCYYCHYTRFLSLSTVSALIVVVPTDLSSPSSNRRCKFCWHDRRLYRLEQPTSLCSSLFDENNDDEELPNDADSNRNIVDGEELAKQFYRQLRERQPSPQLDPSNNSSDDDVNKLREEEEDAAARKRNESPFSQRKVISVSSTNYSNGGDDDGPLSSSPKIKYTGRRSDNERFFGTGSSSSSNDRSSSPPSPSGRQRIIEQEFNLVGRASSGRAIGFQAGLLVLTLFFYIYVGLSGGIQSYNNDSSDGLPTPEDEIFPFEQVMPVQSDREASVWL